MDNERGAMNTFDHMLNRVHSKIESRPLGEPCDLEVDDLDTLNAILREYDKHTGGKSLRIRVSDELMRIIDGNWRLEGTTTRRRVESLVAKRDFWHRAMQLSVVVTIVLIPAVLLFHKPDHSNDWLPGLLFGSGLSGIVSVMRSNSMAKRIAAITEGG